MPKLLQSGSALIMLSGLLAWAGVGCSSLPNDGDRSVSSVQPTSNEISSAQTPDLTPTAPMAERPEGSEAGLETVEASDPNLYENAIERASSAFVISQSAQSQDDWRLVASRWQQAIGFLEQVPDSSPNRTAAQAKLGEYRRNLDYAQAQANRPLANPPAGRVVMRPQPQAQPQQQPQTSPVQPVRTTTPPTALAPVARLNGNEGQIYQAQIIRRMGGTPIIDVVFNGNQRFEMIVDTGASGTLITPAMASALGVVPVGRASVATASSSSVTFPLGYIRSMEVNGMVAQEVLVAIAGPELSVGLLGHDFFGDFDVTIRQNVVEFRERG